MVQLQKQKMKNIGKDGKYNFIRTKDLYKDDDLSGKNIADTEKHITDAALNIYKRVKLEKGDVLYSCARHNW